MFYRLILPLLLCISIKLHAQISSENNIVRLNIAETRTYSKLINYDIEIDQARSNTRPVELLLKPESIPLKNIKPFLSFSMAWSDAEDDPMNSNLQVRFSTDGNKWDEWITISKDEHYEKTKYSFVSTLMEVNRNYRYYQLNVTTNLSKKGRVTDSLLLNFFSPGDIQPSNSSNTRINTWLHADHATESQNCSCPLPTFVNRAGWNCPQTSWNPSATTVTHLIVHHSAGSNTSTNWPAVVLSIWNFHTGTSGYSDMGYNWLIAPDGTLFEGRFKSSTDDVAGAHFCGFNAGTMGVCMLGTFTDQTITEAAKNTLTRLLAWKSCQRNIDPITSTLHSSSNLQLNVISGHRQGCATECPGTTFFNTLPAIRTSVKQFNENGCTLTALPNLVATTGFSLLPNPVDDIAVIRLTLPSPEKVQYRLLHLDGRELFRSKMETWAGTIQQSIEETANLTPGLYILQLQIGNRSITERLIKK